MAAGIGHVSPFNDSYVSFFLGWDFLEMAAVDHDWSAGDESRHVLKNYVISHLRLRDARLIRALLGCCWSS